MDPLEAALRDALPLCGINGGRVLAAVSGGPDSVALLYALGSIREQARLEIHAAHLDHALRGEEAAADAAWVAELCDALHMPAVVERVDVRQAAAERRIGVEEAARQVRYEFLARAARERDCPVVAVAHTADDQAETILHHIVRGTGLDGLRGMPRTRPLAEGVALVRPLLGVRRSEIEAYLRERGAAWRVDRTNECLDQTRNRIRRQLLPLLRLEFNPQVDAALWRLGRQAAEVQELIGGLVQDLLPHCLADAAPSLVRVDCTALAGRPRHLVRELLRRVWETRGWGAGAMTHAHWDALATLAQCGGSALTLPGGVQAERRGGLLVLSLESGAGCR
jgi:tRNA(Ile)-lysidine synthase